MNISYEYIAGLFDGEGCVHVHSTESHAGRPMVVVNIAQANLPLLELVKRFVGYGRVQCWQSRVGKEVWRYEVTTKKDVVDFLSRLAPYLILKKAEAEIAIELCQIAVGSGKRFSMEEMARQDRLAEKMKATMQKRQLERTALQPSESVEVPYTSD